ncbi:MAG: aromatic ring-hydroxylating dioxygenase subunit alpha [Bradyrhizobium sp.]|jgi:nitrite reductase/ring-hydroxylating ferredoxin subunit|uniref:Aromatic ring-hydroxylating dioxygenase subunit alpha n=2 Tax=Bradyrhizobium TaxID=374 RepID=A0ABS5G1J8_9BRAD|nr:MULTISPECIES: aromatic ring-hydroxylating dioxygenase subunit alpha [Bradyrhizobium]MBR1135162.1 aromatic ring-hydroxylating dioxygenase subunit alpha [Bradyrhizobium denitrificans]MDU1494048.1 aromatic ring-hydroxylating dioxygenase subunit alpha [Bradyrhizobium sp.]MDU1544206.1 aromatic ring-hydroxylating dioxygenase subunit alpha [Bradyrhizobium sp.]MDU1667011.1 aromatic ring-hydroxylating dioxygenase subunit alpha [Bradyrhizobium sp.]MDU1691648.1 aromatic ring-hydroxylating dioxygenase 
MATGYSLNGYVRHAWYMAGWDRDFTQAPQARVMLGEPLVVYRTEEGRIVVLADRCAHRLAPLSHGRCEGQKLRCLYHGVLFNPDGSCAEVPGQEIVPPSVRVRAYPAVEKDNAVWVWMGPADKADEALIPDFKGYAHPDWALEPGHMEMDAPAKLIHDNLLDLSHVGWVHKNSFAGGSDRATRGWIYGKTEVDKLPRGVRVTRRMENVPPVPAGGLRVLKDKGPGDFYSWYEFLSPGIFIQFAARYPQGTLARCGENPPDVEPLFSSYTCQAVTPVTEGKARYYFAFGPDSRFPGEKQFFFELSEQAFGEDKTMIEAQYKIMKMSPEVRTMRLAMDKVLSTYEGIEKDLLAAEA